MPRPGFHATSLLVAALVAIACSDSQKAPSPADGAAAKGPPNVVLLVMDTTRADRCSVTGYDRPTTPRLAAFATEGVVFDAAWAPSSWTLPSHASMFTGLLPYRHGATADLRMMLQNKYHTLAEILREAGYATGGFTNNPWVSDDFGLAQGFNTFVPMHREKGLPYPSAAPTHAQALAWVRKAHASGRPFFLFVNDMEPHDPYTPPMSDQARFVRGHPTPEKLAWARSWTFPDTLVASLGVEPLTPADLQLYSDLYDAEIATLDREIGVFVDALRADGLLDDTLVIVAGDHGESFGEHGLLTHCLDLGPQLSHVPLVIRHPGHFTGGRHVRDVVRLEDLFPTVLEVCGLPIEDGLDGRSLLHDVPGRIAIGRLGRPKAVIAAAGRIAPGVDMSRYDVVLHSVFDGRHQLVQREDDLTGRLYDLDADPRGETDVRAGHQDIADRLRAHLPPR